MQAILDIKFDELIKIVKSLCKEKLSELKAEIENEARPNDNRDNFKMFLLNGPTFSKEQIEDISKNRKAINKWRIK